MERLLLSKTGLPTAAAGPLFLHSAYDPEKEADRFAREARVADDDLVLFLGSCLGYPERSLTALHPGIRLLAVYFSDFFPRENGASPFPSWHPGSGEPFSAFLSRNVRETDFRRLKIVEWDPAKRAYPEAAENIALETARFCRELNGSLLTSKAFGRKWIRNCIRNFLRLDARLRLERVDGPVFIAASGPSLEEACDFLKRHRARFSVWALPSSLGCLHGAGVEPDLVLLTDPGHWATVHFHAAARRKDSENPVRVLMPPTAASGLRSPSFRIGFIDQGSWIERRLLASFPGREALPPNGTVAGSAVELALRKTDFPIIVAGLDLCCRGLSEHARPHAFDALSEISAGRLSSAESERFKRILTLYPEKIGGPARSNRALRTYAGWFASRRTVWKGRVFGFTDGPVDTGFDRFTPAVEAGLPSRPARAFWTETEIPPLAERRRFVAGLLDEAERGIRACAREGKEHFFRFLEGDSDLADFFLMADAAEYLLRKESRPESSALGFLASLKGDLATL